MEARMQWHKKEGSKHSSELSLVKLYLTPQRAVSPIAARQCQLVSFMETRRAWRSSLVNPRRERRVSMEEVDWPECFMKRLKPQARLEGAALSAPINPVAVTAHRPPKESSCAASE